MADQVELVALADHRLPLPNRFEMTQTTLPIRCGPQERRQTGGPKDSPAFILVTDFAMLGGRWPLDLR